MKRKFTTNRTNHTNLLCGILGLFIISAFAVSCENPFFPEKRGKGNLDIISVSVTPNSANIIIGGAMQFSAAVANSSNQNVTWSITGDDLHNDTGISADGFLTVSDDETIGVEIIVTAVSAADKTISAAAVVTVISKTVYSIVIDYRYNETGDTVTAEPTEGFEGNEITLNYTVINNGKIHNRLVFGGVDGIETVTSAGSGTRKYFINTDDAIDDVITIIATFTHTDLTIDEIEFTDNSPIIVKTYGDALFTNVIKAGHLGTGTITYSSEDEDVATVDSGGVVTIKKAGTTVITAEKAADAVYAHASTSYTLDVEHKTITITGVTAIDRDFIFENTTVTLTGGALQGVVQGDTVGFTLGNGTMINANAGNNKPVTTAITLTGSDAGNYTLTQPVITVNITLIEILEKIAANMQEIVGGTSRSFQMGQCASGYDVTPVHTVTLTQSFTMSKYQVTQEQYTAVMGVNPSYFHGGTGREPAEGEIQGKRLVEQVSWYDAIVYCNKLSILEGLTPAYSISGSTDPDAWGTVPTSSNAAWDAVVVVAGSTGYRLPTEAQWEYAAKGGHLSQGHIYAGSNNADEVAWFMDNSASRTHQVGLKKPNELGLYDMTGNVREWCWDWYGAYTADAKIDSMGVSSGSFRIMRGGGWHDPIESLFLASRHGGDPVNRSASFGFRVVRP